MHKRPLPPHTVPTDKILYSFRTAIPHKGASAPLNAPALSQIYFRRAADIQTVSLLNTSRMPFDQGIYIAQLCRWLLLQLQLPPQLAENQMLRREALELIGEFQAFKRESLDFKRRVQRLQRCVEEIKQRVEWLKRRQRGVENAEEVKRNVGEVERGVEGVEVEVEEDAEEVDIDVEEVMRNLQGWKRNVEEVLKEVARSKRDLAETKSDLAEANRDLRELRKQRGMPWVNPGALGFVGDF